MIHELRLPNPTDLFLRLQAVFTNPLGQQAQAYRQERAALLSGLNQWAKRMIAARRAYLEKTVSIYTLSDEAQRLVVLDNDGFYTEIIHHFRKAGFVDRAKEFDEILKNGKATKTTTTEKDASGNVTASETVVSKGGVLSNALELEF